MRHTKCFAVTLILSLILLPQVLFAGSDYFWAGDKKVSIVPDRSTLVVVFNEESYQKNVHSSYAKAPDLVEATVSGDQRMVMLVFRTDQLASESSIIRNVGLSLTDIEWYSFGYLVEGSSPLRPTNRISFKLKAGSHQQLERFMQGKATFDHTHFGTPQIKVNGPEVDLVSLANEIYESGIAEYCLPDFIANITRFDDPLYPEQYFLNHTGQFGGAYDVDIEAPEAWEISTGSTTITVAIIDDGVEGHNDLQDANGNSRIIGGFTPINNGNGTPTNTTDYHGQACAGIVAASHNNINVRGVAPNVRLLAVNILTAGTSNDQVADGINWAWRNGADVLSNSWGYQCFASGFTWPSITNAIDSARTFGRAGRGCVVVFAAGNNYPTDRCGAGPAGYVSFPATVPGVICVSATNRNGNISSYSSRGSRIDVTALGGETGSDADIRTLDRMGANGRNAGDDMTNFNGTSAACPQVAGVAALILSVNPNLTEQQVRDMITSNADDMGAAGRDDLFGWGRVNTVKSVARAYALAHPGYVATVASAPLYLYSTNFNMSFLASPTPGVAAGAYRCDRYYVDVTAGNFVNTPQGWYTAPYGFSWANPNSASRYLRRDFGSTSVHFQTVFYWIKYSLSTGQTINRWAPFDPNPAIAREYVTLGTPLVAPVISGFTQTPVPIYRPGSGTVTCNLSQGTGNISYAWTASYVPSSVYVSFSGNRAYIDNGYFRPAGSQTPAKAGGDAGEPNNPEGLFMLTCTASNSAGSSTSSFYPFLDYGPPPPPPGGCPFVYAWKDSGYAVDNNILPQSQLPENEGRDVTDYYQMFVSPSLEEDRYVLAVGEFENEHSFLDQTRLLVVDHDPDVFITVDDSGTVIQFAKPAIFADAQLDSTDVLKYLEKLDGVNVEAAKDETMSLSFTRDGGAYEEGLLLVGQVPVKEAIAGRVKSRNREQSITFSNFRLRRNMSYTWVLVPTADTSTVQIDIEWDQDAAVDYSELSKKLELPFTLQEATLLSAEHSSVADVTENLRTWDENYAELMPEEWIRLEFQAPPPSQGLHRSFVFVSRGRYVSLDRSKPSVAGGPQANGTTANMMETNKMLPTEFGISQNYPNPFNPTTVIKYQLPKDAYVTLTLYDILGRQIKVLVDGMNEAGFHEVSFDASPLASGTYLYALKAGEFHSIKKLLLLR
jgi:hypothetical protein